MKITYSNENINTFGRINIAVYMINNAGVYNTISKHLKNRELFTKYLLFIFNFLTKHTIFIRQN